MTYMLLLNCALKLGEEIILYYDARSKKHKKKLAILQETGWAPRPVWSGAGNLAFTGIRSSDHYPPTFILGTCGNLSPSVMERKIIGRRQPFKITRLTVRSKKKKICSHHKDQPVYAFHGNHHSYARLFSREKHLRSPCPPVRPSASPHVSALLPLEGVP